MKECLPYNDNSGMGKVLVGLSGGVDSAVSAYLLQQQGYDVTAGFMINYIAEDGLLCQTHKDMEVSKEVAQYLGIPFFTFNYVDEYKQKVLDYMYEGYKNGLTPNPDIMCNSEIKFKVFLQEALSAGFDMVATGHYARIYQDEKHIFHLKKGADNTKDQSYFLSGLNQKQLSKSLFPIGSIKKTKVREIAQRIGLPNAERRDSQGICFVGKVDFGSFLQKKIALKPGNIINTKGEILGKHRGVFYYTIGQRKGLELGGQPNPVFVVRKNIEKNELVVGDQNDMCLYDDKLFVKEFHFLVPPPVALLQGESGLHAKAKIRYRQDDQDVRVFKRRGGFEVVFKNRQRAVTPGQVCAIYVGDELIMSGIIAYFPGMI